MASVPQPSVSSVRQELYRRMDKHNLAPLWEVLHSLIPDEPMTPCKPALWKYRDARPYLMEAGKLITAKEAIRRVLVLENPGMRGESCITQSLYAGLQLILPGEIAPSHRHSQSALRFIVEGAGAYTAVDGERTTMRPGDFIITPSWTWHDHGNPEDGEPVVWMDGLDIRIVQTFAAQFHQVFPEEVQPVSRSEGASVARFGQGLVAGRRGRAVRKDLADLQLSVRAQPRFAGQDGAGRGSRRLPRLEDGVHQPALGRPRDAHHCRVHPAVAQRLQHPAVSLNRRHHFLGRRGHGLCDHRRPKIRLRAARHLRRPVLGAVAIAGSGRDGAVRLLRPARPGGDGPVEGKTRMNAPDKGFLSREYNNRDLVPDHPQYFARWGEASVRARSTMTCYLDRAYGEQPGERVDIFPARKGDGSCMMFIHGGYWRALDKRDFSFLAPAWVDAGVSLAIVNYDLCPRVSMEEIVQQMLRASRWLWHHAEEYGMDQDRLYVSGHSAGGHLTAMLMCALWPVFDPSLPKDLWKGGLAISGLYDLRPLIEVDWLNADLKLDPASARKLSPAFMTPATRAPVMSCVGGAESSEFQRQNALLGERWRAAFAGDIAMPGKNHFSVVDGLADQKSALFAGARRLMKLDK